MIAAELKLKRRPYIIQTILRITSTATLRELLYTAYINSSTIKLISFTVFNSLAHMTIGSYNGLVPIRHQAIIWTNADFLSIEPQEQTPVIF